LAAGTFTYRRGVAPMMWVLVALSTIELIVVHLVLAHWWPRVAMVVSVVTLAAMGSLVRAIVSFDRLPVIVDADQAVLRVGTLREAIVPRADIAAVRLGGWIAAEVKRRSTVNLALIAWPNVMVDLVRPLPGRRAATAIALRLDDPGGFAAAVERVGARHD
jgi:hypothetical protein